MPDFVYLLCVWAGSLNVFNREPGKETPINLSGTTYLIYEFCLGFTVIKVF